MRILGIDLSTNATGWGLIEDGELLDYGLIDTSKAKDYYDKLVVFQEYIEENLTGSVRNVDIIGIEDILGRFSAGRTSAKTIITLARFNALASDCLYKYYGIKPVHINVLKARKLTFGSAIPRGENSKEYVKNYVVNRFPEIELPRMKRIDKIANTAYDICDSIIIALALYEEKELNEYKAR